MHGARRGDRSRLPGPRTGTTLLAEAGHELRFGSNAATVEEVREAVAGADAVLNCYAQMPAEVIRGLDRCRGDRALRHRARHRSTSTKPPRKGILVTNVPDYCIDEVSDHALALLLSLARGVTLPGPPASDPGRGRPSDARPLHRLRGRTLGLVGFGRIARALAAKTAPLGFRIADDRSVRARRGGPRGGRGADVVRGAPRRGGRGLGPRAAHRREPSPDRRGASSRS